MAPTLTDGQLVLTGTPRRTSPVRRVDLVVIDSAHLSGRIVKRIIGLPGGSVTIGGRFITDGVDLDELYAARSTFRGEFRVPEGHYFVLGPCASG